MGCLSGDSAHLPTLKHFNHLMPNYFGAEQNRTESHTSFPPRSQMALEGCIHFSCLPTTCLVL